MLREFRSTHFTVIIGDQSYSVAGEIHHAKKLAIFRSRGEDQQLAYSVYHVPSGMTVRSFSNISLAKEFAITAAAELDWSFTKPECRPAPETLDRVYAGIMRRREELRRQNEANR